MVFFKAKHITRPHSVNNSTSQKEASYATWPRHLYTIAKLISRSLRARAFHVDPASFAFLSCLCLSLTNCASTQTALAAACGAIGSFPLLHAERPTFQFTSLPTPCPTQVNFPKSCHEVPPRSRSAVLLGIAAATGESQLKTSATLTHTLDSNTPTKRLLRAYEDEERGISAKIPGLEKISSVLKSSKTKELEGLLKTGESIGNAFKTLKLSTMPIGKNGFIESKLVDPNGAMVTALTNVFGERNLAIMIVLGKDTRSSRGIAKKLESALFNSWFIQKKQPDARLSRYWGRTRQENSSAVQIRKSKMGRTGEITENRH
ncbi:hypothetical protein PHYSODRAFT_306294 [Phytophthora sojae]|uniref:Uncharacterized protein n=1 Tax=Phytophthora sojae (strain P6497) TaxID=1094619 RepID=G5A8X3_PHYSP|nr:hypothetical protein PHYSODRAFT_306294 [Phytophthora sojae]EGZ08349.1 hypothetical protein PHYSODRAFT_306294 [Phytophthora sojae]|eukprot:XP_009536521.1 hypothetical protein PHYSODRAFT_306294 [Phytophthora sojae]